MFKRRAAAIGIKGIYLSAQAQKTSVDFKLLTPALPPSWVSGPWKTFFFRQKLFSQHFQFNVFSVKDDFL
jgi:hypothetical protein